MSHIAHTGCIFNFTILLVHSLVAALAHLRVRGAEVPAHPVPRGRGEAAQDALAVRLAPPVRLLVHPQSVRVREHLRIKVQGDATL